MSSVFWLNNPAVLVDRNHITELWPEKNKSIEEKLNAMTRFVLVLTLLGYITTGSVKVLMSAVVTLGVVVMMYFSNKQTSKKVSMEDIKREGFTNRELYQNLKTNFTNPTPENPLMNVMLPELHENPERKRQLLHLMQMLEKK